MRESARPPGRASLAELVKLLDLASVLGRRASGLPLDPADAPPEPPPLLPEIVAAVPKAYGEAAENPPSTAEHQTQPKAGLASDSLPR